MEPTRAMFASPLDGAAEPPPCGAPVQISKPAVQRWKPSRFNARASTSDGRLILWNTLSGCVSVFHARHVDDVVERITPNTTCAHDDALRRYLVRQGFLVEADKDEIAKFRYLYGQEQWRQDTLELTLLASEDCNFRCVYCYEKFKHGTMAPWVRRGVRALVMKRAPRLERLSISWFGGEPLYGWEAVEEIAPFCKAIADEHGMRHSQNMTTNAYLLTEERATRLLEWGVRSYQITIDGLPAEHDCKRVGRDGSPTYHVIMDNLRSLRERRDEEFRVAIRVNFDKKNLPQLGRFIEILSEDFAGDRRFQLRFRAVGMWGGDGDHLLETCGISEQREANRNLVDIALRNDLRVETGMRHTATFGSQVCYAARPYHFIVGATGKLMKCTVALDEMEENVVGRIDRDGELELNEEYMGMWTGPHYEQDPLCQKCYVLPVCQGAMCPLTRIRNGYRTCCSIKGTLKEELRRTVEVETLHPFQRPDAAAEPARA